MKIKYSRTIKKLAENYHDREVMAITSGINQTCDGCGRTTITTICIEHDSRDISKDKSVCPDCYVKVANYWKENHPNKICPV